MVRPVLRGSRSKDDSNDWVCRKCKAVNRSFKLMLFDVPRLTCSCGRKCPDFHFNMRTIEVNGRRITRNTKVQKGPTCIANAYAIATEIKHCIRQLRHKRDPDDLPELNADNLWDNLDDKFPGQVYRMTPPQRLVHMGLLLKDKGIKALVGGKYYKISDISTIESSNVQAMLNAIGDGEPLVAGVRVGKKFGKLKWCQIYKAPSKRKHLEKNNVVRNHCVVFIGGGSRRGRIFFYFLNSWRNFCVRHFSKQPSWHGVGKIRRGDLSRSVIVLSRQADAGRSFVDEKGTSPKICRRNNELLFGPATAEEDEQAVDNFEDATMDDNDLDDEDWQDIEDDKVGGLVVSDTKGPSDKRASTR